MSKNPTKNMRPSIAEITSAAELKRWYWLKNELVAHARSVGVKSTGAKFDILDRLTHFLETGETGWPGDTGHKTTSKFNWHSEPLSRDTLITDSYKNSQNVRRFFLEHASKEFKFTIAFMEWVKTNIGKTLGDAVAEYHFQRNIAGGAGHKTSIKPHNQFNQYTRDFLSDNPDLGMDDVRRIWALKRAMPTDSGRHVYEPSDLELSEGE